MTCAPDVIQCADTTQTAFGRGSFALSSCSAFVNALCSIAFIGDPWPTNTTGIFSKRNLYLERYQNVGQPPRLSRSEAPLRLSTLILDLLRKENDSHGSIGVAPASRRLSRARLALAVYCKSALSGL